MTHKNYRCCFADGDDRVLRTEPISAPDDASAVLQVETLLSSASYRSAELWDGHRLVGKWAAAARDVGFYGPDLATASAAE